MPGVVADGVNEEEAVVGLDGKSTTLKEDKAPTGIKEEEAVAGLDGKSTPSLKGYQTLNEIKEEEAAGGLDQESTPPLKGHQIPNGTNEEEALGGLDGKSTPLREYQTPNESPGHNSNPHRQKTTGQHSSVEGTMNPSIEQLYKNVCDMESSDQSPSRHTFGSDGDESRIDSELHHLVGGEMREVEIIKEEMDEKPEDDSGNSSSPKKQSSSTGKKSEKTDKAESKSEKSIPSVQSVQNLEVSSKRSPKSRSQSKNSPFDKRGENSPRKEGAGALPKKGTTPLVRVKPKKGTESSSESGLDNPDHAPVLLKQARELISSGENLQKALDLALRACKSYEACINEKKCLELVMCLHVTAAIYCSLGRHEEAIPVLERSIMIPEVQEGQQHGLAKFAGHMQLGDTYAIMGQLENAISCYEEGLEVQNRILGESDPRIGETCRYLAEAHVQALQFDEAQRVCQMALDIHNANGSASLEEAADRRLMGLICETKGDHEAALQHLVLASMAMVANGQEVEVASVDLSIGDNYLALSRYDEAISSYQKALATLKASKGESHPAVGTVFVRLAELYNRTGKFKESQSHCENALKIFEKPTRGVPPEEIATGLTNIAAIYESMNEIEQALKLLQKALKIYNDAPGQQSTIAGIEAQMGVMYYVLGDYSASYDSFKNAISKLRAAGDKKSAFFGIALNQMGLACVQRFALNEAIEYFEEARTILEKEYGPYHPDTLGVYSNLAGTYDAAGRLEEAIEILEYVVGMREEKLGTANPDVEDEKRRLSELLKEAGRVRTRTARSLETLLDANGLKDNVLLRA